MASRSSRLMAALAGSTFITSNWFNDVYFDLPPYTLYIMGENSRFPRTTGRFRAWVIKSMLSMAPGKNMYWDESIGNWTQELNCATRYDDETHALLVVGSLAEQFPIYCKVVAYMPKGPLIGSVFIDVERPDQPYFVIDSNVEYDVAYVNAADVRAQIDVNEFQDLLRSGKIKIILGG